MTPDHVDLILQQWQQVRPDLDCSPMGVTGRILRSAKLINPQLKAVFTAHQLSLIEFDILATLKRADEALTPTQLYQTLMLSSGAMSTRIEGLVKRGLVQRIDSAEDRRSCKVQLTENGMELVDTVVTTHVANLHRILSGLTREEQDTLATLLKKLLLSQQ